MDQVSREVLQVTVNSLLEKLARGTVENIVGILRQVFGDAYADGVIRQTRWQRSVLAPRSNSLAETAPYARPPHRGPTSR